MDKRLDDFDLNLIRLLKAVVETRNTHAAAQRLGISQTSVSRGIAKLKETFGEQLFIRKAHGVEPSELAEKLAEASDAMVNPLAKILDSYQQFDPVTFNQTVTVAVNIAILEVHGTGIHQALSKALPNAELKLVFWQEGSLQDMLNGEIDYLVHFAVFPLPPEVLTHPVKDVELHIVAKKDHPVLSRSSAWEDINPLPIARFALDGRQAKHSHVEELYKSKGYQAKVSLVTHSIPILIDKLISSDAIAFGGRDLAALSDQLACYPLPTMAQEMRTLTLCDGYLRVKRGFPLNQLLHETIQSYYNDLNLEQE